MNLTAGFEFLFLLIIIGCVNYSFMLKRYENDLKKRKITQLEKISRLYPKGTIIST